MNLRKFKSNEGGAAVEFALVLPLILLLLFGLIDFGRIFFVQISLTSASREAARASTFIINSCVPAGGEADLDLGPATRYLSCKGLVGTNSTPFYFSRDYLDKISQVAIASTPGVVRLSQLKSDFRESQVKVDIRSSCHQGLYSPTPLSPGTPQPGTDTEVQLSIKFDWILPLENFSSGEFRVKSTGYMKCLD